MDAVTSVAPGPRSRLAKPPTERSDTSADTNDRVGGARNDDRIAGKGTAPPAFGLKGLSSRGSVCIRASKRSAATFTPLRSQRSDGCGNDVRMETQERFPQGLGHLAKKARFPHSHKDHRCSHEGKDRTTKNSNSVTKPSTESDQAQNGELRKSGATVAGLCLGWLFNVGHLKSTADVMLDVRRDPSLPTTFLPGPFVSPDTWNGWNQPLVRESER